MEQIQNATAQTLVMAAAGNILRLTAGNPLAKSEAAHKIQLSVHRPNGAAVYQLASYSGAQVFHQNFTETAALADCLAEKLPLYKQCDFITADASFTLLRSKKGAEKLIRAKSAPAPVAIAESHDRQKAHILPEGKPVGWLVSLGVMLENGIVPAAKQKKFRQINRFLEMVDDIADHIPDDARIIDAGCGKSYLTFALYDYLRHMRGKNVEIIGLDLKADVVAHCAALAEKFGFDHLRFYAGDIADYTPADGKADMVVSLHACDTATDYALYNAIRWGARVVLAVPCCQHELYPQVQNVLLRPMLKHGILKERFAALLTDSLRASLLEAVGYSCTVMEFIDMEHTPKNIMLRAVKRTGEPLGKAVPAEVDALLREMGVSQTLHILLERSGLLCPRNEA